MTFTFDEFKQAMQNLYGTRNAAQTLVALQKIAMKSDGSVDSLMQYWKSYQDILLFTPKTAKPSEKQLAGVFRGGIRPTSVQNLLLLLKPDSMEETFRVTLGLLQEEDSAIDRFKLSRQHKAPVSSESTRDRVPGKDNKRASANEKKPAHTMGKRPKKQHAQRSTEKGAGDATKETQACFNCGETGHWARKCHKKTKETGNKGKARAVRTSQRVDRDEREVSESCDTPVAQVRKIRRSARIEELKGDVDAGSPSLMRICRLRELFPYGVPLACAAQAQDGESGIHAWSNDDRGRLYAIKEATPACTLMTNSAEREQGCQHIRKTSLPEVPEK